MSYFYGDKRILRIIRKGVVLYEHEEEITATVTPAMSPLIDGGSVEDVTDYSTMVSAGNFESSAANSTATIASVVVAFLGDATAADDVLAAGETAGFRVTVTDSEGNVAVFAAAAITVGWAQPTVATPLPDVTYTKGTGSQTYDFTGHFSGADLSYEVTDINGLTVSVDLGSTPEYEIGTGANAGVYSITIEASTPDGKAASDTFDLTLRTVPDVTLNSYFSVADNGDGTAELTIATLPANGFEATGFLPQYQVDGGTWRNVPSYAGTGDYTLTTDISVGAQLIALRYINVVGAGEESSGESVTVTAAGIIEAIVTPAMSALYEGQAIEDEDGFATETAPANFTSSAGSIDGGDITITAVGAATVGTALSEGDEVGYEVEVTDSVETAPVTFIAGTITVQYKARVLTTAGNQADIDINPLVPDGETISLTFASGDYAGTYTPTAGDIRNGIYNFAGTVSVGYTGLEADLEAGDTLTVDLGLWTSPDDSALTYSIQKELDGTPTGAAFTDPVYTIVAGDAGKAVTFVITASDGTATPVTSETVAVDVPASGSTVTASMIGAGIVKDAPDTTTHDVSGVASGAYIYILVQMRTNTTGSVISGCTFDVGGSDTAATLLTASSGSGGAVSTAIFRVVKASETTVDIEVLTGGGITDVAVTLFEAENVVSENAASASGEALSRTATVDVVEGGITLAVAVNKGGGGADSLQFTAGGLTELDQLTYDTNLDLIVGQGDVTADETARAYTCTSDSGTPATAISVLTIA